MTELIIKTSIRRPIQEVFDYIIDPSHSPEWVESFKSETASPWPPHLGSVYRSMNHQDEASELVVDAFKPPRHFGLSEQDGAFHAEYILSAPDPETTQVAFHAWVTVGELDPEPQKEALEKLKNILEAQS